MGRGSYRPKLQSYAQGLAEGSREHTELTRGLQATAPAPVSGATQHGLFSVLVDSSYLPVLYDNFQAVDPPPQPVTLSRVASEDADAFSDGTATGTTIRVGDTSLPPDTYMAIAFEDVQIDRYSTINSASFTMSLSTAPSSDATYHAHLFSAINPTFLTTAAALRTTARMVAKNDHVIPATATNGSRNWEIIAALQEQVNKSIWVKGSRIVVQLKSATTSSRRSNHKALETGGAAAAPQTLSVSFTPPDAVDGVAVATFPSATAVVEGEVGMGGVTGEVTATFRASPAEAEAFVGTPPSITGQVVAVT